MHVHTAGGSFVKLTRARSTPHTTLPACGVAVVGRAVGMVLAVPVPVFCGGCVAAARNPRPHRLHDADAADLELGPPTALRLAVGVARDDEAAVARRLRGGGDVHVVNEGGPVLIVGSHLCRSAGLRVAAAAGPPRHRAAVSVVTGVIGERDGFRGQDAPRLPAVVRRIEGEDGALDVLVNVLGHVAVPRVGSLPRDARIIDAMGAVGEVEDD